MTLCGGGGGGGGEKRKDYVACLKNSVYIPDAYI